MGHCNVSLETVLKNSCNYLSRNLQKCILYTYWLGMRVIASLLSPSGSKAKVGHVRHISAFRSFSGFIIALRNIPEKFRKKSLGNVIIYQYCYCIIIMFFKYNYFLCLIFSIICIPRSTEVFIHFVSHILAPCNVSSV